MDLKKELKGVMGDEPTQDSPPVEPDDVVDASLDSASELSQDSNKDKKKGRTPDEVRGELLRKQEKFQSDMMQQFTQLTDKFTELTATLNKGITAAQQPSKPASADSLDDLPLNQLEGLRDNVPEEKRASFDAYLTARRVSEMVDAKLSAFSEEQRVKQEREQFGVLAVQRYPELRNFSSDFSRKVQAKINGLPEAYVKSNPRAVLDAANEVALDMGVKPQMRRIVDGTPILTRSAPVAEPEESTLMSDEEHNMIEEGLQNALPRGKKFNRDKIKKREKELKGSLVHVRPINDREIG